MKIIYSESKIDYATYSFPYKVYCIPENKNEYSDIYALGFLPYTGDSAIAHPIFYLARSVRVSRKHFKDTSENRRVNDKVNALNISYKIIEKDKFDIHNTAFQHFCLDYASERFKHGAMNAERFNYVLTREYLTHIIEFKSGDAIIGYVLVSLSEANKYIHYWYAFYDTDYFKYSIGKWMMWKVLKIAQEFSLDYAYLGTCYGESALYKVKDFKGAEFFDGQGWNGDVKELKSLCMND